jgi:hypothetical protein
VVLTNLVDGENLLAVEVHQTGDASVDVVFAAELSVIISSQPVINTNVIFAPRLHIAPANGQFVIAWDEQPVTPPFVLELAAELNGPWQTVTQQPPVYLSPTNSAAFYRLRR